MKYLMLIWIIFCLGIGGFAQQWNPQKTLRWIYGAGFDGAWGDLRVSYLKDTLVDGHICQLLKKDMIVYSHFNKSYSYREMGKHVTYYESGVVYIQNNNHFDTLYYFSGKTNDRYKVTDLGKRNSTDSAYAIIVDTGSVTINTHKLKWQAVDYNFKTKWYHYTLRDTIIERIGATKYYFLPWDEINGMVDANEGGSLQCFEDITIGVYSTSNSADCKFDLSLVPSKSYVPYIRENKIWKNVQTVWLTDGSGGPNYLVNHAYFKGDTIVDNFWYKKFYRKPEQPTQEKGYLAFLMREDTASQKVYLNDFKYNKTALLYDFKLKKGEKFNRYVIGGTFHQHTVVKVDTIKLYNRNLKRIVFDDSIKWIEGIGAINAGYIPLSGELICVTDNNLLMYLNPTYSNCDTIFTQGSWDNIQTIKSNEVLVFPNPVVNTSVVRVNSNLNERLKIEIYSYTGTLVREDYFSGDYPIGSIDLQKGMYVYRIICHNQVIKMDKVIVANQ